MKGPREAPAAGRGFGNCFVITVTAENLLFDTVQEYWQTGAPCRSQRPASSYSSSTTVRPSHFLAVCADLYQSLVGLGAIVLGFCSKHTQQHTGRQLLAYSLSLFAGMRITIVDSRQFVGRWSLRSLLSGGSKQTV